MDSQIPDAVKQALAEILNMAADIAELQHDDTAREGVYELLDSVAEYFDIASSRTQVELDGEPQGDIVVHYFDSSAEPPKPRLNLVVNNENTPLPDRDFGDGVDDDTDE